MTDYEQITAAALVIFKEEHYNTQKGICPVTHAHFPKEQMVVDHTHKIKGKNIGDDNSQLIRGVICNGANRLEGAVKSRFTRYGLSKHISLPQFLRNLADYLEKPPLGGKYIHPSEIPKVKKEKLYKNDYKMVCKYWDKISKKPIPEYPKAGTMTKQWRLWIAKAKALRGS